MTINPVGIMVFIVVSFFLYTAYKKRKLKECAYGDNRALGILKKTEKLPSAERVIQVIKHPGRTIFLFGKHVQKNVTGGVGAVGSAGARFCSHCCASVQDYCNGPGMREAMAEARMFPERSGGMFKQRLEQTRETLLQCAKKLPDDPTSWF
jgi:hypothetical protein